MQYIEQYITNMTLDVNDEQRLMMEMKDEFDIKEPQRISVFYGRGGTGISRFTRFLKDYHGDNFFYVPHMETNEQFKNYCLNDLPHYLNPIKSKRIGVLQEVRMNKIKWGFVKSLMGEYGIKIIIHTNENPQHWLPKLEEAVKKRIKLVKFGRCIPYNEMLNEFNFDSQDLYNYLKVTLNPNPNLSFA